MLWGAPLCFVLQARPVKLWSKIAFYMISNPPGIVSSLLPAPQQAILNADIEKSYAALYRPDEEEMEKASVAATKKAKPTREKKEEIVDDDVDASETEEEEDESEGEEDDEEDEDE
jgi:hypothetical protein